MDAFQIFSSIGITATAGLGIFNLIINIKSQRKYQREYIFTKKFEFLMQLTALIAELEDKIVDINQSYSNQNMLTDRIDNLTNELDLLVTKNELIIPDAIYFKIDDFVKDSHKLSQLFYKTPDAINESFKNNFYNKISNLTEDIRDYLGIETISEENRKLVKGKVLNDN